VDAAIRAHMDKLKAAPKTLMQRIYALRGLDAYGRTLKAYGKYLSR